MTPQLFSTSWRQELILIDVNVLVYAHRADVTDHELYSNWLKAAVKSDAPYGLSDLVLSGFLRVVTHPRVFRDPTPLKVALAFVEEIRDRPNCVCWYCRGEGIGRSSQVYASTLALEVILSQMPFYQRLL